MSGRQAKALRRLAASHRAHLAQEPDPEKRGILVRAWLYAAERLGYGRMMRGALQGWVATNAREAPKSSAGDSDIGQLWQAEGA